MPKKSIIKKVVETDFGKNRSAERAKRAAAGSAAEPAESAEKPDLTFIPDAGPEDFRGEDYPNYPIGTAPEPAPEDLEALLVVEVAACIAQPSEREAEIQFAAEFQSELTKTNDELLSNLDPSYDVWVNRDVVEDREELNENEARRLEFYEDQIRTGLLTYMSIGRYLYAIHREKLHLGDFKTWREYLEKRWQFTPTGAGDLINSYRVWLRTAQMPRFPQPAELAAGASVPEIVAEATPGANILAEAIKEGLLQSTDPLPDSEAPSQRAVDELGKLTKVLAKEEMTGDEFTVWEAVATRSFYDFLRETITGKLTQKSIAEATECLIEIVKLQAVEVDGEHRAMNLAGVQITRDQFESAMREKQQLREMFLKRHERLARPLTQTKETDEADAAAAQAQNIRFVCSVHRQQRLFKIMHGSLQLICGCCYGIRKGSVEITFDPKMTLNNPIDENTLEEFLSAVGVTE